MEKLYKYFAYDSSEHKTVIYYTQIDKEKYIGIEYAIQKSGAEIWVGSFYDTLDKYTMADMDEDNIAVINGPERKTIEKIFDLIFKPFS